MSGFIPACTVVMVHQMVKFNSIGQRSTMGKIKVMTCVLYGEEIISSSGACLLDIVFFSHQIMNSCFISR